MKTRKKRSHNGPKKVGQQLEIMRSEEAARARLSEFLDHKEFVPKPKRARGRKLSSLESSIAEATRRSKAGDWGGSTGRVFVGLYAICYRLVYGKLPIDIETHQEFMFAARLANTSLHVHFNDDPDAFVEFIKWTWEREKRRVLRALEQGYDRQRVIARYQFSKAYVEDYRVHLNTRSRYARNR